MNFYDLIFSVQRHRRLSRHLFLVSLALITIGRWYEYDFNKLLNTSSLQSNFKKNSKDFITPVNQ